MAAHLFLALLLLSTMRGSSHTAFCQPFGRVSRLEEELEGQLSFDEADDFLQTRFAPIDKSASLQTKIIGSRFTTAAEVSSFRRRWDCLASSNYSHWILDPTPRLIPWASADLVLQKFQFLGRHNLNGSKVNEAFKRGEYRSSAWPVPKNVLYNWGSREGFQDKCGREPPSFGEIDVPGFCSALRRRKGSLFFIGDSITTTFVSSLIAELSARGEIVKKLQPTAACSKLLTDVFWMKSDQPVLGMRGYPPCARWMICGESKSEGGVIMHFVGSCHLQWLHSRVPQPPYGGSPWCNSLKSFYWGNEILRENGSIIVLNRGLHFVGKDLYSAQLSYTLKELRRSSPNALLIFRSSTTGHPNCSRFDAPTETPVDLTGGPYGWPYIPEENQIAKQIVEEVGGFYLDVFQMTSLRADYHTKPENNKDCVHYIIPGPSSAWARFFSKALIEML